MRAGRMVILVVTKRPKRSDLVIAADHVTQSHQTSLARFGVAWLLTADADLWLHDFPHGGAAARSIQRRSRLVDQSHFEA
jgi:hypothetical protein